MRVLFTEDDPDQVELLEEAIGAWNKSKNDQCFELVKADSVETANDLLESLRLDAAIFDLRLPMRPGEKHGGVDAGNTLARFCVKQVGIPVAIISGNPGDLDQDLKKLELLKAFDKLEEEAYPDVVAWLSGQWNMMAVLGAARRRLQALGAEIFVQRLWPRWRTYEGLNGANNDVLTQIVARQYAGHLAEALGLDGEGSVEWHPYEFFIHPALLDARAQTGDIFRIEDDLWVVLTPACDMAASQIADVLLARVEEMPKDDWEAKVAQLKDGSLSAEKQNRRDIWFRNLVNQNSANAEHFLPPFGDGLPMKVKFKQLSTKPLTWLTENLGTARVASIASAFLPNLTQRFGAWVSRSGQPNIDIHHFG